tara:strand:- start:132 stop:245 length:114 start_codon:yes stop_codon:yes gene_type:complete
MAKSTAAAVVLAIAFGAYFAQRVMQLGYDWVWIWQAF